MIQTILKDMQLKNKPRLSIIIFATLLMLYILAFALGRYYITPEYVKTKLSTILEEKFEKKVTIDGDLSFKVSWDVHPQVTIESIRIEDMLSVQKLHLNFSLLKLIFKEVSIDSLTLEQAKMAGLIIKQVVVEDLIFDDKQARAEITINQINTQAENGGDGSYTIPDDQLPIKQLAAQKVDFAIKIKQLTLGTLPLKNVDLRIFSKDQKLNILLKPAAILADGNLNLELNYNLKPKVPDLKLKIFTKKLTLEGLSKAMFNKSPVAGSELVIKADLNSNGTTLRNLIGNLKGQILATSGPGKYLNSNADLGNFLATVLSGMITFDKRQANTNFECAVVNFKVNNGVADANNAVALQAASVNVLGSGRVDLRNGQINFKINPQNLSKNPLDIAQFSLAQSITVSGTIGNPQVNLNPLAAITSGALNKTILSTMAAGLPGGIAAVAEGMLVPKQTQNIVDPCKTALGK